MRVVLHGTATRPRVGRSERIDVRGVRSQMSDEQQDPFPHEQVSARALARCSAGEERLLHTGGREEEEKDVLA